MFKELCDVMMHVIMYAIMYVIILYDGVGGCHGQLVTVDGSGTTIGDVLEGLSVSSRAMMLLESGVVHVVPVEEYPRIVELSVVGTVSDDAEGCGGRGGHVAGSGESCAACGA